MTRRRPGLRNPTDIAAGLLFLAVAGFAWWLQSELRLGTAMRMGPGYMPMLVTIGLAVLGAAILARALLREGPAIGGWVFRPILLVLAAVALFAASIRELGLVAAVALTVVVSAFASSEARPFETLCLAVGLCVFSVVVFARALGLPLDIWPMALAR